MGYVVPGAWRMGLGPAWVYPFGSWGTEPGHVERPGAPSGGSSSSFERSGQWFCAQGSGFAARCGVYLDDEAAKNAKSAKPGRRRAGILI